MDKRNGNDLCDLVKNYAEALHGMVVLTERNKYTKEELVNKVLHRTDKFQEGLLELIAKQNG